MIHAIRSRKSKDDSLSELSVAGGSNNGSSDRDQEDQGYQPMGRFYRRRHSIVGTFRRSLKAPMLPKQRTSSAESIVVTSQIEQSVTTDDSTKLTPNMPDFLTVDQMQKGHIHPVSVDRQHQVLDAPLLETPDKITKVLLLGICRSGKSTVIKSLLAASGYYDSDTLRFHKSEVLDTLEKCVNSLLWKVSGDFGNLKEDNKNWHPSHQGGEKLQHIPQILSCWKEPMVRSILQNHDAGEQHWIDSAG
jgi:hypothetical protein